MKHTALAIEGVLVVEPEVFRDERGALLESYQLARYRACGIEGPFLQDNRSYSTRGVLRGLHFQAKRPQAKLVTCVVGSIFDVAVDLRPGSSSFGRWVSAELTGDNRLQLYVPAGFAHGFLVTSDDAIVEYKCSSLYDPTDQAGIRWDDPALAIRWPSLPSVVSPKDRALPTLEEVAASIGGS